jgi:phenylalanine-4-hydroxylase
MLKGCKQSNVTIGNDPKNLPVTDRDMLNVIYRTYPEHLECWVQAWRQYYKKDTETLEKLRKRAAKMVVGITCSNYADRLKYLGLYELEKTRLRDDLVETFNILNGKERVNVETFFQVSGTIMNS